jgi:hypothetical protein
MAGLGAGRGGGIDEADSPPVAVKLLVRSRSLPGLRVSNLAFHHADPGHHRGASNTLSPAAAATASLSMSRSGSGALELVIVDNGPGYPLGLAPGSDGSLGVKIMRSAPGGEVRVQFPVPERAAWAAEEDRSFLKKRTKKLLLLRVGAAPNSARNVKSFLLLFFKKEVFLFVALVSAGRPERPALLVV